MAEGFLMKRYSVTVQGFSPLGFDAPTPAKARAEAWRTYCSYDHVSFKRFLEMSSVRRDVDPEGYGRPITVSGAPAFFLCKDFGAVRFVRPGETKSLFSHPCDVKELAYANPR